MNILYILLIILILFYLKYIFLKDFITESRNNGYRENFKDIETQSYSIDKDNGYYNLGNETIYYENYLEKIEIKLSEASPEHLIEYKKIICNSEHSKNVLAVFTGNEVGKDMQRKDLKKHLIIILYILLIIFNLTAVGIFVFLAYKSDIKNLIILFKWFLLVTLGEIIAMIFFIVKFLFNDNVKMYEQIKNIILNK